MLHNTAQERYKKLRKVFDRLKTNFNRDDLDDFVQTANSLREWIRQDSALTVEQRSHLERFVIPEGVDWQICNQIANRQKHAGNAQPRKKKNRQPPSVVVKAVHVGPNGAGFVVTGSNRTIGTGEEIIIEFGDHRESALGFVIRIFRHFHYIFEIAPIPLEQRNLASLTDDILA